MTTIIVFQFLYKNKVNQIKPPSYRFNVLIQRYKLQNIQTRKHPPSLMSLHFTSHFILFTSLHSPITLLYTHMHTYITCIQTPPPTVHSYNYKYQITIHTHKYLLYHQIYTASIITNSHANIIYIFKNIKCYSYLYINFKNNKYLYFR